MKCGHPQCSRGIGLVSHRRWFSNKLYCSRACRDNYAGRPRATTEPQVPRFLVSLFEPQALETPAPVAAVARVRPASR